MHGARQILGTTLAISFLLLVSGCGGSETSSTASTGGGGSTSTSTSTAASTGSSTQSVCANDPRAMTYAVGLEQKATDGKVAIRFVDAAPAPPAKGNNTWTVRIVDGEDKPLNGATLTVEPFMPDHGHGGSIQPKAMGKSSDGTYVIENVNFFMPGVWEVTFQVQPQGGAVSNVVFTFCVEG